VVQASRYSPEPSERCAVAGKVAVRACLVGGCFVCVISRCCVCPASTWAKSPLMLSR
jgi:hypothetical protein